MQGFRSSGLCTTASTPFSVSEPVPPRLTIQAAEAKSPVSETLKIDTGSPSTSQKLLQSDQSWFPNKEQALDTCKWLTENYEPSDGYSLPKSLIYNHYYAFCTEKKFIPVNTASFGKVIRHAFPQLKTRRLGSRGQSKYHYYGIKVKHSSADFHLLASEQKIVPPVSTKPAEAVQSEGRRKRDDFVLVAPNQVPSGAFHLQPQLYSTLVCASSSFLPNFPDASNLSISAEISVGQVNYLISSYRSHCVQILETVLRGGLNDVGFLIEHFWQHLNDSCRCMLEHPYLADTIAICDTYLYHTIVSVLLPGTVQPLPPNLLRAIRNFACLHTKQVEKALKGLPQHLIDSKLPVAKRFSHMLKRKTTLAHLAQASRGVLSSEGTIYHMKEDWEKRTEQKPASVQVAWSSYDEWGMHSEFIMKKLESYSDLLKPGITVEDHIHWLEMLIKGMTSEVKGEDEKADALRSLILQWGYLSHLIIRDQTLRSATSFGSFHLLNLLYQEYMLYVTDIHHHQLEEIRLWKSVFGPESDVLSSFLTYPVVCDLEECILRDSSHHQASNGTQSQGSALPHGSATISSEDYQPGSGQDKVLLGYPHGMIPIFSQNISEFTNQPNLVLTNSAACNIPTPVPTGLLYPIVPLPYHVTMPHSQYPATSSSGQQKHSVRHKKSTPKQSKITSISSQGIVSPKKDDKSLQVSDAGGVKWQTEPPSSVSERGPTENAALRASEDGMSTRLIKVIPVHNEGVGKDGDAKEKADPVMISVSVPESQDLSAMQGQVLVSEGGKSYIVDDIQSTATEESLSIKKV